MLNVRKSSPLIVFDADGVMIQAWGFRDRLGRDYGLTPATTASFFRGPFLKCIVGEAQLPRELEPFLERWNWQYGLDAFLEIWFEADGVVDAEMVDAVRRLRAAGYRCYLATNQERLRAEYIRSTLGFDELFDGLFFSCDLGHMKPDRPYFDAIRTRLAVDGADLLFFDNASAWVDAAREAGWRAEHYTGYASFMTQIQEVLGEDVLRGVKR